MTPSAILCALFIVLIVIQRVESSRCSKKCTFKGIHLNSSLPSDFCSSLELNDDIDQQCIVELTIDFTTGLVNGSFDAEPRSILTENRLLIETTFSLNYTSVKVDIKYNCSVSDYCDVEFVRETLSPAMAAMQVESIRQNLVARLYDSNNTEPIQCRNNETCFQNTTFCVITYIHWTSTDSTQIYSGCQNVEDSPSVGWNQLYEPYGIKNSLTEVGTYYCNTPNCGYNTTAIETFQMLAREYILPVNLSVINATTPPWPTVTTTSQSTIISTSESTTLTTNTATTTNHASYLLGHFFSFLIISFLITNYFWLF